MAETFNVSLKEIRQFAAREAGKFLSGTCTSGTTTAQVEDLTWPVASTVAASGLYKDYWLYTSASATADQMRLVKTYVPGSGLLQVDWPYTTRPNTGDPYELHGMFPPVGNASRDWLDLINAGLRTCQLPAEVTLTPSSSSVTRFTLASFQPWLSDPLQVRRVGVLSTGSNREATDPYVVGRVEGRCFLDGNTIYLDTWPRTFATTDTLYLRVMKPAYYMIQANGSGPFTQTGMSLETDVAPCDQVEWPAYAALVVAWRRFAQLLDQSVEGRVVNSLADAVTKFNEADPQHYLREPLAFRRVRAWGPPRHGVAGPYVSGWSQG